MYSDGIYLGFMNYHALDDHALITLVQREDAAALSELYDRYGRLVFSLARQIVGDAASAEEITQDVFVRVWEKAISYDGNRAQVSTWITRIARNRSIDVLRHRQARADFQTMDWEDMRTGMISEETNPEKMTFYALRRQQVLAALRQLPESQRQALFLAYFYGMSQREIAEHLNQPLGTVKTRIRLGMQKLRTLLAEEHPQG